MAKNNKSKSQKIITAAFIFFFVVVFIIACVFVLWEPVKSAYRQKVIDDSLVSVEDQILRGEGEITYEVPLSDSFSIVGEDEEDDGDIKDLLDDIAEYNNKKKKLHCIGILEIPSIEVKEPIWDECDRVALRFGVGRYPSSANFGENKNVTILGHRNRHISTIFYRLQKIEANAVVRVTLADGSQRVYEVTDRVNVPPKDLPKKLSAESADSEQLTLVTCATELGKGWRFLAICSPLSED